eukprot:6155536-Pyramimonas_sp.AAC.1
MTSWPLVTPQDRNPPGLGNLSTTPSLGELNLKLISELGFGKVGPSPMQVGEPVASIQRTPTGANKDFMGQVQRRIPVLGRRSRPDRDFHRQRRRLPEL